MQPLITIRKSMWSIAWTFIWTICLCFLILPVFYLIYKIVCVRKNRSEIYENRVIDYEGVFNIRKTEHSLTNVLGVSVNKTMFGNMFGYGDLNVNLVGKTGLHFERIANIDEVEQFFKSKIVDANTLKQSIIE